MALKTLDFHMEPCILEVKLSESQRKALLQRIEQCMSWGFGSVEIVVYDHRIKTVYYKETVNENKLT